jgi:hypothetical protein
MTRKISMPSRRRIRRWQTTTFQRVVVPTRTSI